jgi:stage V sporulation protein B
VKQSFMQGTIILFVSGIFNRLLGFVPRIILPRVIGAEGVGLFQLSYPFLILMLTVISGGLPIAIAKMIAEEEQLGNQQEVNRIFKIALLKVIALSVICAVLCFTLANWMSIHLFRDERVYYAFLTTIPMLFIVGISSVIRGYFQGKHNMLPTAISQIVETVIRLFMMILFATLLLPYGLAWAAAGAMLGVVCGELAGFFYLLIYWAYNKSRPSKNNLQPISQNVSQKTSKTFKRMFSLAVPMTTNKLVTSTSYFFESILIIQSLAIAGISASQSTSFYGILQGMIIPILVLPNALTYSLTLSLIPALSQAFAIQDWQTIRKRLQQSLKLCVVAGIPFVVIMFVFAESICMTLYQQVEFAYMLQWMAPFALFLYVQGPLQAALQALNRSGTALRNTLIAALIKLLLIYVLASKPELGINGVLFAINVNILITTLLHWLSVRKSSGLNTRALQLPSLFLSAILMTVLSMLADKISAIHDHALHTFFALCIAIACYVCFLFAFRIIQWEQLAKVFVRKTSSVRPNE